MSTLVERLEFHVLDVPSKRAWVHSHFLTEIAILILHGLFMALGSVKRLRLRSSNRYS